MTIQDARMKRLTAHFFDNKYHILQYCGKADESFLEKYAKIIEENIPLNWKEIPDEKLKFDQIVIECAQRFLKELNRMRLEQKQHEEQQQLLLERQALLLTKQRIQKKERRDALAQNNTDDDEQASVVAAAEGLNQLSHFGDIRTMTSSDAVFSG
jgi:hypothetical protein